jgi:hypothetical protein
MKSEKIKKLLKKIKKLKKLKKSKKIKKTKSQNLYLSADIETLKQKLKQQEILLSQMKYPQSAPVSTVSYERLGIGQQNALNQANLETIQKNIEDKLEDQAKLIDIPNAISNIKKTGLRPQKENESDADYNKYVKKSISNRKDYLRRKELKKSLETTNNSSGVKNLINTKGTLKKPIYSDTDNQGEFPKTDFYSSVNTPNSNETFDENVQQINNEITSSLVQMDNRENYIDTSPDQNVPIVKSTKKSSNTNPKISITNKDSEGRLLSKKEIRNLNKKNKTTINTNNIVPVVDINLMNDRIANNEALLNRQTENINKKEADLGLFIPT